MKAGINTDRSILARQLSLWSDWTYSLCLTKNGEFKENIEKLNLEDRVQDNHLLGIVINVQY